MKIITRLFGLLVAFISFGLTSPVLAGPTRLTTSGIQFPDGTTQTTAGGESGLWSASVNGIRYYSGNVGIGVFSPEAPLHIGQVVPGNQPFIHLSNSSGASGRFARWTNRVQIRSSDAIGFAAGGTDMSGHLWITSSGNVGMGTTSPSQKLEVDNGNIRVQGVDSFTSAGDEAILYLGNNDHFIKSRHSNYVQIGTHGTGNNIFLTEFGAVSMLMTPNSNYGPGLQLEGGFQLFNNSSEANGIITDAEGKMAFYRNTAFAPEWIAMVIDDDTGNVGIGETNPVDPLHVVANVGGNNVYLEENTGGEFWQMGIDNYGDLNFKDGGTDRVTFRDGGNVGIGYADPSSYKLQVYGTAYAVGAAGALSDRRHKKNINDLSLDALRVVKELRPVTFAWKEPQDNGMEGTQFGFIAQEVEEVLPETVLTQGNDEQTKGLKYSALIPVLTKAIQQLEAKNEELKARSEALMSLVCQDHSEAAVCQ